MSILIAKKRRKGSHKTMARRWQNVSGKDATKVTPAARKPGQVLVKPPIINQAPPKVVGVKPPKEQFFPERPLRNPTKPSVRGSKDERPWESPFWPEGACSRHLGNENCQCGKVPTRWNEPGCPKPDTDLGQVVNEETERFG